MFHGFVGFYNEVNMATFKINVCLISIQGCFHYFWISVDLNVEMYSLLTLINSLSEVNHIRKLLALYLL